MMMRIQPPLQFSIYACERFRLSCEKTLKNYQCCATYWLFSFHRMYSSTSVWYGKIAGLIVSQVTKKKTASGETNSSGCSSYACQQEYTSSTTSQDVGATTPGRNLPSKSIQQPDHLYTGSGCSTESEISTHWSVSQCSARLRCVHVYRYVLIL